MKQVITITLICLANSVFSQELIKQKCYRKENGECVPRLEVFENPDGTYLIKEYYINGEPKLVASSQDKKDYKSGGNVNGYDQTGKLRYEGSFKDGAYHGGWKLYGSDGSLYEGPFRDGVLHGEWNLYGSDGRLLRTLDYGFDADTMYTSIREKKPESGNAMETVHLQDAKFQGGRPDSFTKYLTDNLFLPPFLLEEPIFGKTWIIFDVDTHGDLVNIKMFAPLDPNLDKEILRTVLDSPKWEPATKEGKPVQATYVVPLSFNLE